MLLALIGAALATNGSGWTLVGVYDASSVTAMESETAADYAWQAATHMNASCGPAKRPDGLGVFEATAIANRLTPTSSASMCAHTTSWEGGILGRERITARLAAVSMKRVCSLART